MDPGRRQDFRYAKTDSAHPVALLDLDPYRASHPPDEEAKRQDNPSR